MVKVALVDPSLSTGTSLVSALSRVNSYFFLAGAAPLGSRASVLVGCATAAALKTSWSTCSTSLVSPDMVMTPLLPGIFMRLYAG